MLGGAAVRGNPVARPANRTRRQSLGEWLAAENRRRGGLARIWPRRVVPVAFGLTLWVSALVLATTVAMQPFEHGATVVAAEQGQWLIERVSPGGPAWRAGLSAGEAVAWNGPAGEATGRPVELSAAIDPGSLADPQTGLAIPFPGLDPAMRATTLVLATVFAAGGAVVALYGRRRLLRAATAALFGVAIALSLGSVAPDAEGALTLLVFAATGATGVALLWFAAVCPIRGPAFMVPFVPALAVTALAGPVAVLVASYQGRPELYNAAWVTVALLPALGLTALLAKCLVTLVDITFPRDRRVARVLLATFLTAALPPTALSLVPAVVSGTEILPYSVSLLAIGATALGVAHVGVPTWRIRFQRVLRTLFLHGAAWILLFTFYALLVGVIGRYLTDRAGALPVVWMLAAALVGIGVTMPFARWLVLRALSGWVYQDSYDTQRVMRTASAALASTASIDQLAGSVLGPVRRVSGLDWIAVTRATPPHKLVAIDFNNLAPTPDDAQVRSAVVAAGGGGLSEIAAVVVPCKIDESVVAYVVASIREESFGFSQADANLLDALGNQLASFMVRVDLWGQLQDRLRELDETAQRLQDSQQTLSDLYDQVNGMLEAERQRISRDLHDEPLQKLVLLQRALRSAAPGPYRSRDALLHLVDTAAGDLREICERLRPPVLDDLGLEAALRWLVEEAGRAAPFTIDLQIDGTPDVQRPDTDVETNIYRAAQEALNNALRHSQASRVRVRLTCAADAIRLSIQDDGCGFPASSDLTAYAAVGHLGLAGLQERFSRLGGRMHVDSKPGGPTVLTVEAPLHPAEVTRP